MIQDIPWPLLEKHFAQETGLEENKQVQDWICKASENSMIFDQLKEHYKLTGSLPVEFVPDSALALDKISPKLKSYRKKVYNLRTAWYGAAASILIIVGCLWLFSRTSQTHSQSNPLLSHNTSDTTTSSIVLSDGTKVWLNNGSKLEYPEKFGATREVSLLGEGYFEVAHDPSHPFLVKTKQNTVKVLGTKFDIRSYQDDKSASVAVTEGRVGFGNQLGQQIILHLGQQCTYLLCNQTFGQIASLDPNVLAWKTKEFIFDDKPLSDVFKMLSKVYRFDYTFINKDVEKRKITTQLKKLTISDILSIISAATKTEITTNTNRKLEVIIN